MLSRSLILHKTNRFIENHPAAQTCVVVDFDECLVNTHMSRLLTLEYIHRINGKANFQDDSVSGIMNLLRCYVGLSKSEIVSTCKRVAKGTSWRPYALKLLKFLKGQQNIVPLILSSGLDLVIDVKLGYANLFVDRIACELKFNEGEVCIEPLMAVSGELKGTVIEVLKDSKQFSEVYTIGHSNGDIPMLQKGTGIALKDNPAVEAKARYVITSFKEVFSILGVEEKEALRVTSE